MTKSTKNHTNRLHILNKKEIHSLYSLPEFTRQQKEEYFSLDDEGLAHVRLLRRPETKVYFILMLGYYRYRNVTHRFQLSDVGEDIEFIQHHHLNGREVSLDDLPPTTVTKLTNKVMRYVGHQRYVAKVHDAPLMSRLLDVATSDANPRFLLDELISHFRRNHMCLPGYSRVQELVSQVIAGEQARLSTIYSSTHHSGFVPAEAVMMH